jgi:hypothetical protein
LTTVAKLLPYIRQDRFFGRPVPALFGIPKTKPLGGPFLFLRLRQSLVRYGINMPDPVISETAATRLADQLWAEHGWGLDASDLLSLLIAMVAASALMCCLS